ncbi:L-histidine N(alpha)-methyltransferase [Sphingobacterium suaedae]|uniref:L-histidine N(Alpha)-methyltransferase n=1 Tax=Sphingobacterium suaedae TaxID=1686402 RepID=A0ABW5KFL3_9SPHI
MRSPYKYVGKLYPMFDQSQYVDASFSVNFSFYEEVVKGLSTSQKTLPSKYFYDERGDRLFQAIMHCPEYYLSRCEQEIFESRQAKMAELLFSKRQRIDLIELGAGDASKTFHLLKYLLENQYMVTYRPLDISAHILFELAADLRARIPQLNIETIPAEYIRGLEQIVRQSSAPKVLFFLGANIGNMTKIEAHTFCRTLRSKLQQGDKVLIGFDLIKNPRIIQAAYDDQDGLTWDFNINLLTRINRELGANFNPDLFEHYCTYIPETGECHSYLVSLVAHEVTFPDRKISFEKDELIHTEVSRKYQRWEIDSMALTTGFSPVHAFLDNRQWFVDVVWEAI